MKKHSEPKARKPQSGTAKATTQVHAVTAGVADVDNGLHLPVHELAAALEGLDETCLSRAKTHWFFGEWAALVDLNLKDLNQHPDRDRLAILVASAHQQLGNHDKARNFTRLALEWGCPPRIVAQVLTAGVHNTLGRAAILKEDENSIAKHFEAAVVIGVNKETVLVSHTRSIREMARMGLLPQAASLVGKKIKDLKDNLPRPVEQQTSLRILATELELLQHELSLAQQRQQLFQPLNRLKMPSPDQSSSQWLEKLKKKAVSQLGQDLWVLDKINYKRGGFFVEFGATDGVLLSNTWLLEKEFGWDGICIEPNPGLFDRLKKNRNCTISDACIGKKTGEKVEFIFADVYGGMTQHAHGDMHGAKRQAYHSAGEATVLPTISLHDFLLQHRAPKAIDYLSIDTEGSEFDILNVFPFDQWNVRFLTVEHNYTEQRTKIRKLLEAQGFVCEEAQWDDWYYKLDWSFVDKTALSRRNSTRNLSMKMRHAFQ